MIENQQIEFKSAWREEYIRYVSAFSNSEGGTLYVGVDDNGKVCGVENVEKLLETIPNIINQKTGILPSVELKKEGFHSYIAIRVHPSIVPISYHGHYYVRSGSVTTEMQGSVLSEFIMKRHGITWEDIVVDDFNEKELDLSTIERFKILAKDRLPYIQHEKDPVDVLQKLNLMKDGNFKRAAVLLFAKNPQKYFLQARIRIGKFLDDAEILTSDIVEGNLFYQVDTVMDILKTKYLLSSITYEGIYRREKLQYPYEALREAVLNAVVHRNYMISSNIQIRIYENKLLIMSDGKLPDEISIEDLQITHSSIPRNFLIADTFYKAGQIENWGRGTIRIIEECEKDGLPKPHFIQNNTLFTVRFESDSSPEVTDEVTDRVTDRVFEQLTENQKQILQLLLQSSQTSLSEIAEKIGISKRKTIDNTNKLKSLGFLKRIGTNKTGYWKVVQENEMGPIKTNENNSDTNETL